MGGQVRQVGEVVIEVYRALRDTQEGGHSCVLVGITSELIKCSLGVQRLHALKVYSRSSSCSGLGRDYC